MNEKQEQIVGSVVSSLKECIAEEDYAAVKIDKGRLVGVYDPPLDTPLDIANWEIWDELQIETKVVGDQTVFALREGVDMASWAATSNIKKSRKQKPPASFNSKKKKNANYFKFPEEAEIVENTIKSQSNIFLSGPTGCGKTTMLELLANKNDVSYTRMNLNGETTVDDFIGVWTLKDKKMEFADGVLPRAMKKGQMLILDEMDAAQPEILFVLQAVLQGSPLVNTKNGETVDAVSGFFIAATANTVGRGDVDGLYAGSRTLNEAFLDRFPCVLRIDYPKEGDEAEILVEKCGLHDTYASEVVMLANAARHALNDGALYSTFSTRKAINMANALVGLKDIKLALRVAVLDRVSKEDASIIMEAAQRIWQV